MPTARALALAQSEGFDLVEIAPNAQPPVARVLDYGKYRFEEQQRVKEAKKKQKAVTWKEIRMAPKIDEHDIETKMKAAARFLDEGDKLKITVRFRGRELAHPDRGRALLLAMGERLKEHGTVERLPLLEGRQMVMVMNPLRRDQLQRPVVPGPDGQPPGAARAATASRAPAAPRTAQAPAAAAATPGSGATASATPRKTPGPSVTSPAASGTPDTPPAAADAGTPAATPDNATRAARPPAAAATRPAPTRPAAAARPTVRTQRPA